MEDQIRIAAFQWLKEQTILYGEVLPRALLERGFEFHGQQVTLVGPSSIWKPRMFERIPLSITTIYEGPYEDSFTRKGFLNYRYRGTDPFHRDNVGLRQAMKEQVPLIYFHNIIKGKYLAVWPVFIIQDNPEGLQFTVAADEWSSIEHYLKKSKVDTFSDAIKNRLPQKAFREAG